MTKSSAKVRVAAMASRQFGRISATQLRELGVSYSTVAGWLSQGYLHRLLPRVYAVGHAARSVEADLSAALLYAGPGATLSHATAAWWLGLIDERPRTHHVSTPRRCRSLSGIEVHARRRCARATHKGLPTTTMAQTLLDLAATQPLRIVRRALANGDYRQILDMQSLDAALGHGRPGAQALRAARSEHEPRIALTKSELELTFLELCEAGGIPLPAVNVRVAGWEVDALWREERVAVELDGYGNHRSPAQVKRDRRKELDLRAAGFTPLRYSGDQLLRDAAHVLADLRRARGE